jgi:predicted DCC family thiol-disulfide oxidoreductase YuxK
VKYLYDGDCPMCRTLKNVLTRQDGGAGRVAFVNIADPSYDEDENEGIAYEDAMETIHVIKADGDVVTGPDALRLLYDTVGLGWASRVAALPLVSWVVDRLYDLISKYRLGIGGVDAVIALKRLSQVEAGEDQCEKHGDTGCDAPEW